jgi:hypothetical protein
MHPDLGILLPGRVGDQHDAIAVVHALEVAVAAREDRPVNGRAESTRLTLGKRTG